MDVDADEVFPLIQQLSCEGKGSIVRLRTALLMMSGKINSSDQEQIELLVSQCVPVLESLAPTTTSEAKPPVVEWLLDSLSLPLRQVLTADALLNNPDSSATLLPILDTLYDSVLTRNPHDVFIDADASKHFGFIIRRWLFSESFKQWAKDNLTKEFIAKWVVLTNHFDFGSQLDSAVKNFKIELPEDLAEQVRVSANVYKDREIEQGYQAIVTSLAQAQDTSLPPQVRRRAFKAFVKEIEEGSSSTSSKKAKEHAAALVVELNQVCSSFIQSPDFNYFLDQYMSLCQALSSRSYSINLPDERYDWAADSIIAFIERFKTGDLALFNGIAPMGTWDALIRCVASRANDRTYEIFDLIFKNLDVLPEESYSIIQGAYYQSGDAGPKAVINNMPAVLKLAKAGNQTLGQLPMMMLSTHKEAFLPYLDEILDIPSLCGGFLASNYSDSQIFKDKIPQILRVLSDPIYGNTAALIVSSTIVANIHSFTTTEALTPVVDAFTANSNTLKNKDPIPIYLITILSSVTTASEQGNELGTPIIINLIETLLDANPRHPQTGDAIQKLLVPLASVANFNSKVIQPHMKVLTRVSTDPVVKFAGVQESLDDVMNAFSGLSLRGLSDKFKSSMQSLGINPDDPFFAAVEAAMEKESEAIKVYDCMLSYNWTQQPTVIRIRDSLVKRGFSVWLDMEQMSGNVYSRMCEAVLGSKVVIPCMSKTYEASGNCKRELGFAADQTNAGKKIVPVRLDDGPFTWTALITSGLLYTYIGAKELSDETRWEQAIDGLAKELAAVVGPRQPEHHVGGLPHSDTDLFTAAVEEAKKKDLELFDCMLSYNWSQQQTVLRIFKSLEDRGLKVWMDLDEMSGNVYTKMSEAVLGSAVVVSCLSDTYEASGNCRRELNFAYSQVPNGKKIVAVELTDGPFTWTNDVTQGLNRFKISDTELQASEKWESLMTELATEIRAKAESGRVEAKRAAARAQEEPSIPVIPLPPVPQPLPFATTTESVDGSALSVLQARVLELEETIKKQNKKLEKQAAVLNALVNFIGLRVPELNDEE
ncbi:hypothetical protein HDU99_003466 [Rhizoclosmatium hyalinum]|nr:hypothetical protein HDU99_003466 [Rhizoclosmatium hyalinum]